LLGGGPLAVIGRGGARSGQPAMRKLGLAPRIERSRGASKGL